MKKYAIVYLVITMNTQTLKDTLSLLHIVTYYPIFLLDHNYQIIQGPQYFFSLPDDYFCTMVKQKVNTRYKTFTKYKKTEFYTFFPYENGDIAMIMIGPILYHKPFYKEEIYDNEFLNSLHIYPRTMDTLLKIPHITYRYYSFLQLLYRLLKEETLDTSAIFESVQKERANISEPETFQHHKFIGREIQKPYPYHLEKQLLRHMIKGESSRARTIANDILKNENYNALHMDSLQKYKYLVVQMAATFRNALIDAGVDIESAFQLCYLYVNNIDSISEHQQLWNVYMDMIVDFSTLSKKRRFANYPLWVRNCIDYIIEHMHEHITLEELAEIASLNTAYLSVQFKKITGYSVIEFHNLQRVEEAKFLLEETTMSIMDISTTLGFSNQGYFTKTFKKYTNDTPFSYRQRLASFCTN